MKTGFLGFLLSISLVIPAAASTISDSVTIGPASSGTYTGVFDFSSLIETEAANGFNVVFTSGNFSFSGSSARVADPYTQVFNGSRSSRDCGFFGCDYHYWDQYTSYSGDRTTDSVYMYVGDQGLFDHTNNGYTSSTSTATINGNHAHILNRAYSSYGDVYAFGVLNASNINLLNSDGEISYQFTLYGDPFEPLSGTLTLNYDLVAAVPLPASAMMLITGLGGFGLISVSRSRRRKKKRLTASNA